MTEDHNKQVWLRLNSANQALQWDNTYADMHSGHANTVFFTTKEAAERTKAPADRSQGIVGDAALINNTSNVTL